MIQMRANSYNALKASLISVKVVKLKETGGGISPVRYKEIMCHSVLISILFYREDVNICY